LESDSECEKYRNVVEKNKIIKNIDNLLKNGDCFELIDGENLEFKSEIIKGVIESYNRDKVIFLCVIGP
jgi:hypothetical protein